MYIVFVFVTVHNKTMHDALEANLRYKFNLVAQGDNGQFFLN